MREGSEEDWGVIGGKVGGGVRKRSGGEEEE